MSKKITFLVFIFFYTVNIVVAEPNTLIPSYHLKYLSNIGESDIKNVSDLVQDSDGYTWIGTTTGLFRFDGYSLKEYVSDVNSANSIPHFHINSLLIDHMGRLWVGTTNGLAIYNKELDNFDHVYLENDSLIKHTIYKLLLDSRKNVWVGTKKQGVFIIGKNGEVLRRFSTDSKQHKLKSNNIRRIFEDQLGNIWLATRKSINKYDPRKNSLTSHLVRKEGRYIKVSFENYSKDSILVGTEKGLFEFDTGENKWRPFNPIGLTLQESYITELKYAPSGELLIGTNTRGLHIYNSENATTSVYSSKNNLKIKSNSIRKVFIDSRSNLWTATKNGIFKVGYGPSSVNLYRSMNNEEECLTGKKSYAVLEDRHRNLWVGIVDSGIHRINLSEPMCELFDKIDIDGKTKNLSYALDMAEDASGNVWIAGYKQGLVFFEPNSRKFSHFISDNPKLNDLMVNGFVYDIEIGDDNVIWFGLEYHGLAKIDLKTKQGVILTGYLEEKIGKEIVSIKAVKRNKEKLWLSTISQGVLEYDFIKGRVKQHIRKSKSEFGIPENITAMKIDRNGMLWLGTRGFGLLEFDTQTEDINAYNKSHGMPNNTVWNIEEDNNGYLWIGTNKGLAVFNPANEKFYNYFEEDGLQANEATTSGHFNRKTGIFWTGGMNGINRIDTNSEITQNTLSKVLINELKIDSELVPIKTESNESPLSQSISYINNLALKYDQNDFSLGFLSIDYHLPLKIKYRYKLEGYDDWQVVSAKNRQAKYTNIDPGQYVFKVQASSNGEWSSPETTLNISISPPWWKTNVAYVFYIVVTFLSIYLFVGFRTRALKLRSIQLEKSVNERTQELAQEKYKVEQLLEKKNDEFANVSHEFRTPLTLILGPVQRLFSQASSNNDVSQLNIIQRNGYRLLRMVDQMLNMETFRVKSITQREPQNFAQIIWLAIEAFQHIAADKNITLKAEKIEKIYFEFTVDAFDKIVLNLISNAVKYTGNGGAVNIESYRTDNNELCVIVSDSGIGIPAEQQSSIFERFTRVINSDNEQVIGAGIGLALVKELVEAHRGRVELTSLLGKGTQFMIYLPIINETKLEVSKVRANEELVAMELMSISSQETSSEENDKAFENDDSKDSVLVIEDNSDMRGYIRECIKQNYHVLTAKNGEEGVELALQHVPDIIISDIMMPKLDGYQVTKQLRNNEVTNHIPIILLTAKGDLESRLKGWREKADEYLTKPFSVEELLLRIKSLLDIRNILKKRFAENAFEDSPVDSTTEESNSQDEEQQKFLASFNAILENIYTDGDVKVKDVAEEIAMSERQFYRKLKSVVDLTPKEYMRRFRLNKARELLASGKPSNYVAFEVGFSSQSYFSKCFKAQYGVSPSGFVGR